MIRHILVLCSFVTGIHAVTVGQVDTFEDGTTMNWFVPGAHPFPPANITTGGPAGVNDNFLMLTATGNPGAGGRLAVLNESQWQGNYLALGYHAYSHGSAELRAARFASPSPVRGFPGISESTA